MSRFAITNVTIFDGSGADPFMGDVLVNEQRISQVVKKGERLDASGAFARSRVRSAKLRKNMTAGMLVRDGLSAASQRCAYPATRCNWSVK